MTGLHAGYNNPTLRLWQVMRPNFSRSPETYFEQIADSTFEGKKSGSGFDSLESADPDPRSLNVWYFWIFKIIYVYFDIMEVKII